VWSVPTIHRRSNSRNICMVNDYYPTKNGFMTVDVYCVSDGFPPNNETHLYIIYARIQSIQHSHSISQNVYSYLKYGSIENLVHVPYPASSTRKKSIRQVVVLMKMNCHYKIIIAWPTNNQSCESLDTSVPTKIVDFGTVKLPNGSRNRRSVGIILCNSSILKKEPWSQIQRHVHDHSIIQMQPHTNDSTPFNVRLPSNEYYIFMCYYSCCIYSYQ
jgi:hypothetical protein